MWPVMHLLWLPPRPCGRLASYMPKFRDQMYSVHGRERAQPDAMAVEKAPWTHMTKWSAQRGASPKTA